MAQSTRTFRVFVSSTFSDLKAERNALQERVFPRLRDLAVAHGCRFQAIDLRWGVSEEAAIDQQTMKICLGEIHRCQMTSPRPNFIILLGDRYGWRPLPWEIWADEFDRIFVHLPDQDKPLILAWYRRDDNAIPPVYVLQPRTGEYIHHESWGPVELQLHALLEAAAARADLPEADLIKYTASATEQEIIQGAIQVSGGREHIFCFSREVEDLPQNQTAEGFIDLEHDAPDVRAADRLIDLKGRLKEVLRGNFHQYPSHWQASGPSLEHLDPLCEDVYRDLEGVILREVAALEQVDPLEKEIAAHETFGRERTSQFLGRADILKQIDGYLLSNNNQPLAVWGSPGSGKSALLAKAAQLTKKNLPSVQVIQRFIGATPDSSDGRSLLKSLCREITRLHEGNEEALPSSYDDLVFEFLQCLGLASEEKPLAVFLDSLDQLSDANDARNLAWLPDRLPPYAKLVVSTLPGECMDALAQKIPMENQPELHSMPPEEAEVLLNIWLDRAGRTLQSAQRASILEKYKHCRLPLYLKLAFEEACRWSSFDEMPEGGGVVTGLGEDIAGVLGNLFRRLSQESNHGELLVARSLGCLAASKNGLSEDELLEVLSADPEILANFHDRSPKSPPVKTLPVVVWSRLHSDLEPYLVERTADGTALLAFYHPTSFGKAVTDAYLAGNEGSERHRSLAAYFQLQPLHWEQGGERIPNLRKLSELPWQLAGARSWPQLYELLSDLDFFQAAWNVNEFDVRSYWTQLEHNSDLSMVNGYQEVLDHPDQYDTRVAWETARLMNGAGYPEAASSLNAYLIEHFRQEGDQPMLAAVLGMQANIQYHLGNLEQALELHRAEEQICRALNSKGGLAFTLINQAPILYEWGAFDEALSRYQEAESLFRALNEKRGLAKSLTGQAIVFSGRGDHEGALALFKESERLCRLIGHKEELIITLVNQANTLFHQDVLEEAGRLYQEAEGLCREVGNKQWLAKSLGNQANILYRRGELDGAMLLYQQVAELCLELGDKNDLQIMLNNQARILEERGKLEQALTLYQEAERLCREMGNKPGLQNSLRCQAVLLDASAGPEEILKVQKENERVCRELGDHRELAISLIHQAVILGLRMNQPRAALQLAGEAYQLAVQCGDETLANQIESIQYQIG